MAKVRLFNGKPLLIGGKVALADACCCGASPTGCVLPEGGDCPHAFCWELNLATGDICNSDFVEISSPSNALGFYFDLGSSTWRAFDLASFTDKAILSATSPFD